MAYQSFEELEVWKRARSFKNEIHTLVKRFPTEEKFRLSDQLIPSSRSINSQIAEGHGRQTNPDRLRFCIIARGSLSETLNHLIDAFDCQLISHTELDFLRVKVQEIEKLLNGYITFLQNKSTTK
ncbi:four helix bundle protein [Flavisolibacter tropicus]|uniref:S23 ribosomal protein n=1 Tax=Flavisolibacter tropicus TaxID=1492898 RepID=A0A172TZ44_9BACT|nr:four helix bundle protein [Flavisolibacter tropicus]ANE52063.1 S23 ribosomal protein [Flavisolibacter tropicus]